MRMSNEYVNFLAEEFGLDEKDFFAMGQKELYALREKCFDIEADEAYDADGGNGEISARGKIATELVDLIPDRMKALKKFEPKTA